ncbi:MAG TPA: DUF1702 family protein [Streptosporangiaceae bacterium]|nr:DUF1702 family protein [Streptosporangiaceae bacterium]
MANYWQRLRSRILTPNESATRLDVRGFHVKNPGAQDLLETIGRTFLQGYACATEAGSATAAQPRLDQIPVRFRGFAYEGAAMGFAVMDGLPGGRRRLDGLVSGPGSDHIYMVYVGMGWAMARLPRFRWSTISAPDPLLRWLVLDGYGFHQAYFRTDRYVRQQFQDPSFPWPADGPSWYAQHAIDQGVGRALWFVCGTDTDLVATTIDGFPEHRRADLYSGVGLAATYAGGAEEEELRNLRERAGDYRAPVAQGCAFGAEARLRAGLVVPHVELATRVLCGMTPAQAADVCARKLAERAGGPARDGRGLVPAYEIWRQSVAEELVSLGRR